jgi:hypothetical protein
MHAKKSRRPEHVRWRSTRGLKIPEGPRIGAVEVCSPSKGVRMDTVGSPGIAEWCGGVPPMPRGDPIVLRKAVVPNPSYRVVQVSPSGIRRGRSCRGGGGAGPGRVMLEAR